MKVEIQRRVVVKESVEVGFPLYLRQSDGDEYNTYDYVRRITDDGRMITITSRSGDRERIVIEQDKIILSSDLADYLPESGGHQASSEAEFNNALERAIEMVRVK